MAFVLFTQSHFFILFDKSYKTRYTFRYIFVNYPYERGLI